MNQFFSEKRILIFHKCALYTVCKQYPCPAQAPAGRAPGTSEDHQSILGCESTSESGNARREQNQIRYSSTTCELTAWSGEASASSSKRSSQRSCEIGCCCQVSKLKLCFADARVLSLCLLERGACVTFRQIKQSLRRSVETSEVKSIERRRPKVNLESSGNQPRVLHGSDPY